MKRTKYTVRYYKKCPYHPTPATSGPCTSRWGVQVNGKKPTFLWMFKSRADAVLCATINAKRIQPSQVVVRTKRGTFAFERTYPDTTPRRKG